MTTEFIKDPSARLDYQVDWSTWLDTDTITAVAWTVPSGPTNYSSSYTITTATIWLSSGTAGTDYIVTCQITTAAGRIDQRSILIQVRER